MPGYNKMLLVLGVLLSLVLHCAMAAKNGPPAGEGDCITQSALCVIAYLEDMSPSQQTVSYVQNSWKAGRGMGWAVGPGSSGTISGRCGGKPTSIHFDFGSLIIEFWSGDARASFDYTNDATLLLVGC
ncbi:unnamed protein product [Parajaminaea phylloscopi]